MRQSDLERLALSRLVLTAVSGVYRETPAQTEKHKVRRYGGPCSAA